MPHTSSSAQLGGSELAVVALGYCRVTNGVVAQITIFRNLITGATLFIYLLALNMLASETNPCLFFFFLKTQTTFSLCSMLAEN